MIPEIVIVVIGDEVDGFRRARGVAAGPALIYDFGALRFWPIELIRR